jgi:hypothetical protein
VGFSVGTGATNVPIRLAHKPSGAITFASNNGAVVFQTSADVTASTPSVFVCRATAATVVTLLVG